MTVKYTPGTWDLADCNAAIVAGEDIELLETGIYPIGTGDKGLVFESTPSSMTMPVGAIFDYAAAGSGIYLGPSSTGTLTNATVRNTTGFVGKGIEIDGTGMRLNKYEVRNFESGLFLENSQIFRAVDGRLMGPRVGIAQNRLKAQNLVDLDRIMTRGCRVGAIIEKARGFVIRFADFEASKEEAVIIAAKAGGAVQSLVFDHCWFEDNNKNRADGAVVDVAEVVIDSGVAGFRVNGVIFRDCYWSHITNNRVATHRIRIGPSDAPNVSFEGGFPAPMADIHYL